MPKSKSPAQSGSKNRISKDPHAQREAENYENPIHSREHILEYLNTRQGPATLEQLSKELALESEDHREALRRRLIAMVRDGQLLCNRRGQYAPISAVNLIKGIVLGHRDGFGFLQREGSEEDIFISARQMQSVFPGDKVLVRVDEADFRGRESAVIVEVLERNTQHVVGRLYREGNIVYVEPENRRISQEVFVSADDSMNAKHGQYVTVEIIKQPSKRTRPLGKVVEVLGDHMAPGMEIDVAIRSHNLPYVWPMEVERAVEKLKSEVLESDKKRRIDIRHLPLVTIDGEDAKDFDDAVYCETKKSGGWRLYVAIADVSHYVRPQSALDEEARNRGTSVYFPGHVLPMLPEVLSNGLCSLNPKVDRLCMVCEMTISGAGKLSGYQFYEAVMHSHARLTYNQVGAMLEEPDSPEGMQLCEDFADLLPHLHDLYQLYFGLRQARVERGAIDFETVETQIVFGEERKIEEIVPVVRNDAHKIIEECMLCANVAAAQFVQKYEIPALLRVHDGPSSQKLENLRSFLSELGLQLQGGDTPEPTDYQSLLSGIQERPDLGVIQTVMLRSMSQAVYAPEDKGHFGLGYAAYTHFTSPIRRYPDLLTHRAIKSVIYSEKESRNVKRPERLDLKQYDYPYDMGKVVELGEHCSMAERRADDASRDVLSWLKCEYLQQHLGTSFEGLITSVTGFGFFVELKGLYAEGLVHVSSLNSDYYQFDKAKHRLVGERTGRSFKLGDEVSVQVVRVDLDERMVDLNLVEQLESSPRRGSSKSRRAKLLADFGKSDRSGKSSGKNAGSSSGESDSPWGKSKNKGGAGKSKSGSKAKPKSKSKKAKDGSNKQRSTSTSKPDNSNDAPLRKPRKRKLTK